jgi:hypothetical protein
MGMGVGRDSMTRTNPRRRIGVSFGNPMDLIIYGVSDDLETTLRSLMLYPTELRAWSRAVYCSFLTVTKRLGTSGVGRGLLGDKTHDSTSGLS